MKNLTINAYMTDDSDKDGDDLAERGVDIELPEGVDHRRVMALLFDGFCERLAAAGISYGEVTAFT